VTCLQQAGLGRYDDLLLCYHRLSIVTLDVPITSLHDPAVKVSQVGLGLLLVWFLIWFLELSSSLLLTGRLFLPPPCFDLLFL